MPYRWSTNRDANIDVRILDLWPYNSLSKKGFAGFILITFCLTLLPLLAISGTGLFWGLLPFTMFALWAIWTALQKSYKKNQISEQLRFDSKRLKLIRKNPSGDTQSWVCEGYWSRASLYSTEGPVPFYITLHGNGREVEIGAFLSESERKILYDELREAIACYKR